MIRTKLHYALLLFAMVLCACVWTVGYRGFGIAAASTVTFSAAFLCTQFRIERGVWMGGALILLLLLPQLVVGIMMVTGTPTEGDDAKPAFERLDIWIGLVILVGFFAFATYATVVNFRLFSPVKSSIPGGEQSHAPKSRVGGDFESNIPCRDRSDA